MLFFTNEPILKGEEISVSCKCGVSYKEYCLGTKNKTNPFVRRMIRSNLLRWQLYFIYFTQPLFIMSAEIAESEYK